MTSSPKISAHSRSWSTDAATAMTALGCRWSTCWNGTKVWSGVSIEQARGFRLKTQWLYIGYMASSIGVLGPRSGLLT